MCITSFLESRIVCQNPLRNFSALMAAYSWSHFKWDSLGQIFTFMSSTQHVDSSQDLKERAVHLCVEQQFSFRCVANLLQLYKSTLHRWVHENRRKTASRSRVHGRPGIHTAAISQWLHAQLENDPFCTCRSLAAQFHNDFQSIDGFEISITLARNLCNFIHPLNLNVNVKHGVIYIGISSKLHVDLLALMRPRSTFIVILQRGMHYEGSV